MQSKELPVNRVGAFFEHSARRYVSTEFCFPRGLHFLA
jgi:hypothetical protein